MEGINILAGQNPVIDLQHIQRPGQHQQIEKQAEKSNGNKVNRHRCTTGAPATANNP